MASSWEGRPILLKGESSRSMPSVKATGLVVRVKRDDPKMSMTSRIAIKQAR